MDKKRLYSIHSRSQVILVIAIIVVINILLISVSWRLDLTQDKQYTLAEASRTTIEQLKDPVTIKIYFSNDVPQNLLALKRDVTDLVAEYQQVNKNNVVVEQVDPKTDPTAQQEVTSYNIPEIQYNVMGKEKFEVSTGYAGMAMVYGSTYQTIPVISDSDNLEYEITAAIQKMSRAETPKIGWLSDHDVISTTALQQYLSKQYAIESVTLDKPLDSTLKSLIIAGPSKAFSDKEQYVIDQFLMHGGNVIVLLDGAKINQQYLQSASNSTGLEQLLASYSVTVHQDVLADFGSPENLTFGSAGKMQIIRPYPFWARLVAKNLNTDNPITAKIQAITMPWPSSITTTPNEGTQITELAKTSSQTFSYGADGTNINPEAINIPDKSNLQQYTTAVLVSGKLTSAFANKTLPADVDQASFTSTIANGHLAVISNAEFVSDDLLQRSLDNSLLLVNTVDALTQDTSLISIRSRSALDRPIDPTLSDSEKMAIKYGNIFSGVVMVVLLAGAAYFIRKRNDFKAINHYA